jgi:hypothetical protein
MPSVAWTEWTNDRMPRLAQVDAHCAAQHAIAPVPLLADESLRGYVMLLSAHFQGFCRDLYTECSQKCAAAVPPSLLATAQAQFASGLKLSNGNPNHDNIQEDFERFGLTIDLSAHPSGGHARVRDLSALNKWRNKAAHHTPGPPPAGVPPLTLAEIQRWRVSCDGLATALDDIMYNALTRILGAAPW